MWACVCVSVCAATSFHTMIMLSNAFEMLSMTDAG